MKISLLTLLLIAALSQPAFAQTSPITFGAHVGLGIAFLSESYTTPFFSTSPGLNCSGGGLVNIPLGGIWSLQPEVHFMYESGKRTDSDTATYMRVSDDGRPLGLVKFSSVIYTPKMSSLHIPLLIKASFGEPKAHQINVFLGPTFSYIVSGNSTQEYIDTVGQSVEKNTFELTSIKHFQVGITVGVEYRILTNLLIDTRFNYSITNYVESDWYQLRFANAQVGLAFLF